MTNQLYPKWKELLLQADALGDLDGDIRAILIDTGDYTYSSTHDFLDDVATISRVATTTAGLGSKTFTNGAFDAANFTWASVSGDECEAIILFRSGAAESSSALIAYYDSAITGMPVTPNSGDINVTVAGSGFFTL